MTSRKNTKKALLASALSLLLCISMLIGSTYAWFTDTASTAVNTIQSGTLDVALEMWNGTEWVSAEGQTLDFVKAEGHENEAILWEPGCTYELPELRIVNKGNLALKYKVIITGINGDAKLNEAIEWTIGDVALGTEQHLLPNESNEFTISGHMKEAAGNEYQNLTIEGISITVVATQYTYESDSNNNRYDANAAYPVVVEDAQSFVNALNDPNATVIVVSDDITYDWGGGSYGNAQNLVMQNKIIRGATGNEVLTVKGYGSANNMKNVTLENLKVSDQTAGDNENSWEDGYLEVENLIANNVEFLDGIQLNGNCVLTNCTFNGKTVNVDFTMYAAWVNGGTSTFTNCTFNGTRGLKTHEEYGSDVTAITVDGCTFKLTKKPGVVIGTVDSTTAITIKNSAFIGVPAGDQNMYFYESDTNVSTFNLTLENNTYFDTAVSGTLPTTGAAANENVFLTENITGNGTLSGIYSGTNAAFIQNGGIIDGNGKTVTLTNTSYGVQTNGGTIKNLTIVSADRGIMINQTTEDVYIDGVTVSECGYGINTGEVAPIGKKLIVTNSTINGWSSWAGGLESASFTNCSFEESSYWTNLGYDEQYTHYLRPFVTTTFTNCDFSAGFYLDLTKLAAGCTVTLENCTCNGVALTSANFADYIKIIKDVQNGTDVFVANGESISTLIWG